MRATSRITAKLIATRIRAVQAAGLIVAGVAPDGTVLTALPDSARPVSGSAREDEECRRLFLRDEA